MGGGEIVKEALKRPRTCQIVTLDWLEDSMHKRKRLDEEPYSHLRALRRAQERERKRLMVVKGLEKAIKQVNPSKSFLSFITCFLGWIEGEWILEGEEDGRMWLIGFGRPVSFVS